MKGKWIVIAALCCAGCGGVQTPGGWTEEELGLINAEGKIMRVLTVENDADLKVLRDTCVNIGEEALLSEEYAVLAEKMVATVTSPEQDGVGIAGPQVGLERRVVAVMRYDKEGEPFEVYPNIRITAKRGELEEGAEGCLSIPGRRGIVPRYRDIDISYEYINNGSVRDTTERVTGFTAVIFQHECVHRDGALYTDYLSE